MPPTCCVSGCNTGKKRKHNDGAEKPILLQVPKNETEFNEWKKVIPDLVQKSKVCSLHFWGFQIITYNEIPLHDGSVFKSKTVPHLVQGTIPSRFLDRASGALESERVNRKGSSPKLSPKHCSPPKIIIPDFIDSHVEIMDDQPSTTSTCMTPNCGSDIGDYGVSASTASSPAKLSSDKSSSTTTTSKSTRSGSAFTISNSGTYSSTLCSSEQTSDTDTSESGISTPRREIEDFTDHAYAREMPYTLQVLRQQYTQVALPSKTWSAVQFLNEKTAFIHTNERFETDKAIVFNTTMKPEVLFGKITYPEPPLIDTKKQLEQFILKIDRFSCCTGATDLGERSETCWGFLKCNPHKKIKRCLSCRVHRRTLQKGKKVKVNKTEKRQKMLTSYRKQSKRRGRKILSLKKKLADCFEKCRNTSDKNMETIINSVPIEQREILKNIFMAAKCQNTKGRRYSRGFIYECLIMRMKGHALYKKLRRDNKLPLPSEKTLNKAMKGLKAEYGFQDSVFKIMGLKGKNFDQSEKHGCLLLDEMQIDALVKFRADLCEVHGFVNLAKYTPPEQKEKQGDHGLVLMFQPFKGQWVQTLGAFLSAAAVPGHILKQIILEAIVLLYNQGFTVDIVTTDGARWNRAMWKLSGVNINSSCTEHPCDENKKLWFASDFPHLVKTMWTRVVSRKEMSLPDGMIKLSHWETVLAHNEKFEIKQCWTLRSDHLKPSNYQKMNVKMAFEFFGGNILSSMKYLKERNLYPELADCGPTIKFIERMNDLIKAMNSKDVLNSLSARPDCPQNKILTDFLDYLYNMHDICKVKHPYGPRSKKVVAQGTVVKHRKTKNSEERIFVGAYNEFTTDAFLGLIVTIKATLELVKYLTEEVGFKFLMTRRLNQDALEHFFGEIRTACGSGSHPDPLLFIYLYRLLSLYSLVKPPRGSNVSGGELFQALVQLQDLEKCEAGQDKKQKVVDLINSIVEESSFEESPDYETCTNFNPEMSASNIDEAALCLMAGYVSFKVKKMKPAKSCSVCSESLVRPTSDSPKERERLIEIKSRGGLLRPSDLVYAIIVQVEQAVILTSTQENLHTNTIFSILENVRDHATLYRVGCDEHQQAVTSAIVTFYLTVRMHFQCREVNKQTAMQKKKNKNMAKMAKLQSTLASTGGASDIGAQGE